MANQIEKPKVFLGVGHGGNDPGAFKGVHIEKNYNLDIALSCKEELIRHGIDVAMSRAKDENDTLPEEIKECNAFNPALAVDVHNNAGGGDGFEAYYYHKGGTSLTLAKNIEAEVIAIGQNSRGCKTKLNSYGADWFGWIRETNCPAVLAEFAFVDSSDVEEIDTAEERKKMGVALAKGILKTLGIAYQSKVEVPKEPILTPAPAKQNYISYKVQPGDSWWGIAQNKLGNGNRINELLAFNGHTAPVTIYAGNVIKIPCGTSTETVTVPSKASAPKAAVTYFKATPYIGVSIASGLSAIKENSSYNYRAQIAKANGIINYSGTATQNTKMLNLLQKGKLIKP